MNYEYYRVFYYVGRHKNITRAARELYTSQPAVTRVIKKLEEDLGCTLLVRTKKGVELTPEGETLFSYVSTAEELLQKGSEEVSSAISVSSGTVYIATTVTALEECLFGCLDTFHLIYPRVKFKISTQSSDLTIEKLNSGAVDLAFVTTPFNSEPSLNCNILFNFKNVLIAGNRFEELRTGVYDLADLGRYPFASLSSKMQLRAYIDELFLSEGVKPSHEIECDSADLLVPMVSHNLGLGIVPESFAAEAVRSGRVFPVALKKPLPDRSVQMIVNPHHPQSKAAAEFRRLVMEKYQVKSYRTK